MDNRTDFRPRGPAYFAEQARRALVLPAEIHELSDVPLPLVHAALGVAVCALAVLVRPQAVGLRNTAILVGVLAVAMVVALMVYDFLVYEPEGRPGLDGMALPIAALIGFECVAASSVGWGVEVAAAAVAALVIGAVPHLAFQRAAGRDGLALRVLRDAAGVATLSPVMILGVNPSFQWWSRGAVVLVAVTLVTFDSLRTEDHSQWVALATAPAVGWMVAGASTMANTVAAEDGIRAGLLLVLWYGLRGLCGALAAPRRHVGQMAEYVAFAAVAFALLWGRH